MAEKIVEKLLGQARPSDTNAATLYTLPSGKRCIAKLLRVCNTTGTAADVRVFLDNDGSTYDESTALVYDESVPANDHVDLPETGFFVLNGTGATLGIRSATASALTFHLFGAEIVN